MASAPLPSEHEFFRSEILTSVGSGGDNCPVCWIDTDGQNIVRTSNCNHPDGFHPKCLYNWFHSDQSNRNTCPICRRVLWYIPEPWVETAIFSMEVSEFHAAAQYGRPDADEISMFAWTEYIERAMGVVQRRLPEGLWQASEAAMEFKLVEEVLNYVDEPTTWVALMVWRRNRYIRAIRGEDGPQQQGEEFHIPEADRSVIQHAESRFGMSIERLNVSADSWLDADITADEDMELDEESEDEPFMPLADGLLRVYFPDKDPDGLYLGIWERGLGTLTSFTLRDGGFVIRYSEGKSFTLSFD